MDSASIKEYVDSAQSDIEDSPQMGETTTKASLLNKFIELLGWEIPRNTELEYSVKAFGSTYKIDYALVLDGRPVAFLEAKGLDTPLTPDFREKFEDYLRGENVNWGILANGQEYEFYQRRVLSSKVSVDLIEQTTLDQLPSKNKIIEAYRPEVIRDEESEVIIEHIRELREAWQTLGDDKDKLATAVADTLTDSVPDAIEAEAESQAKEMIDRLIADIESQIDTDTTGRVGKTPVSGGSTKDSSTLSDTYVVEIVQQKDVIETFDTIGYNYVEISGTPGCRNPSRDYSQQYENPVQSDLMASIVNYLIQNHDLISAIEPLPHIPAEKRAIIHDTPTYNDRQMKQPRELVEGHFLEVNLSWNQKKREMKRLADDCGLEVTIRE